MQQLANLGVFDGLMATANAATGHTGFGVFNAEFAGLPYLTVDQRKQVEPLMDAVLKAERTFREEDNAFRQQEEMDKNALSVAQHNLKATTTERMRAANIFEKTKASLEAPLKPFGVTVVWDEPQVDAVRLDKVYA